MLRATRARSVPYGSALTVRTQSISVYGTTVSELLPIQFGVPQGSFLGPLLFLPGVTKTGLANIL